MATWSEDSALADVAGPEFIDGQADDISTVGRMAIIIPKRGKILPVTTDEVIAFGRGQIRKPSQDWYVKCQSFCRQSYRVPAWSGSAIGAWNKTPKRFRNLGTPSEAPRGALLYYSGGKYGHVAIAIGKKTHDKCLSNDYVRRGQIDVAPRTFPRWGLTYVGWSAWTPWGSLDV